MIGLIGLTEFISNHKLLCLVSLGSAIIGYLGYRTVCCLLGKAGLVKRIDEVGQQRLIQQADHSAQGKIELPPLLQKGPLIVQNKQSVSTFIGSEYKGGTVNARKYAKRLELIADYFGMPYIQPVRGDGNCFANAALAGLMHLIQKNPEKKAFIAQLIGRYAEMPGLYVSPDLTETAPFYSKKFNKADDFKLVMQILNHPLPLEDGMNSFEFASAFARIIRYILHCNREKMGLEEEISLISGSEIDAEALALLNQEFEVNAKLVVLQGPSAVDSGQEGQVCCYQETYHMLDLEGKPEDEERFDFLIIRKGAHFLAMLDK